MHITASKLYDYIQCAHRVWRDQYGPQDEKVVEPNPFVELLWEKGSSYEKEVVERLGTFLDLSKGSQGERRIKTLEAMKRKEPLIYQGLLEDGDLLGIPDLLRLSPDGSYMPIDIKSGMGYERDSAEDEDEVGKPKKHYAVQLGLYVELLRRLGFKNDFTALVFDIHGNEVEYQLSDPMGVRNKTTFWEFYEQTKEAVRVLLNNEIQNTPAMAGCCRLCPWNKSCKKWCSETDDLTNVFYVGRKVRDTINQDLGIEKTADLSTINIQEALSTKAKDKNFLKGIRESMLKKMTARAKILKETKSPVVYEAVSFPKVSWELFFDIEDDPTQEFVYMHGVYERHDGNERYVHFTAQENTATAEKEAWGNFWQYINQLPKDDFAVYYYSHHEKTTYKKMQREYPDVISEDALEAFFENPNVIDLYKIVLKNTDWPVGSYSLKELAVHLGFKWRDETPSGALSIQWFNEYLKTKDSAQLERILLYNEDDCKATMVLKDGIEKLSGSSF
jgi:predicted RecB family nuclease